MIYGLCINIKTITYTVVNKQFYGQAITVNNENIKTVGGFKYLDCYITGNSDRSIV